MALNSTQQQQDHVRAQLEDAGLAHRTIDHGYCVSLYVSDPDGLTVEFTVDADDAEAIDRWQRSVAHDELRRWLAGDHTPNNHARGGVS